MIVKHYGSEKKMENPWGLQVIKLHDSAYGEVLHLTLSPEESMIPHISPVNLLFFILEGEPLVRIDNEKKTVTCGSFVESPAGSVTCVSNPTANPVRLLIVKIPKSDQKPVFVE